MRELSVTEQDSVAGGCLNILHTLGMLFKFIPRLPAHNPRETASPLTISNNYGVIIGRVGGRIGQISGYVGETSGDVNMVHPSSR